LPRKLAALFDHPREVRAADAPKAAAPVAAVDDPMAIKEIVCYPDPRLRQISRSVDDPPSLRQLVEDMAETMYALNGAGLAAIQIGEPYRLFIIDAAIAGGSEKDPPIVFFNPEILELSKELETADEGCLSFPGIYVPIARSLRAKVRAQASDGSRFEFEGEGLVARALQHETDHLNGKLLADFVGRLKRKMIERKLLKEQQSADDE
jgi:peptide deformylase